MVVKNLAAIRFKIKSSTIDEDTKKLMGTTIKNMISAFDDKHLLLPVLKFKSDVEPCFYINSLLEIPNWTILPSQVFVNKLKQFELPPESSVHEDVLTEFSPEKLKKFSSFFELIVHKVLEEAGDFFELIKSPEIKDFVEHEVKQLKIHVLRVTNHNHRKFSAFKSVFIDLLCLMMSSLDSLSFHQSPEAINTITKLSDRIQVMKQIITRCKGNGIPNLKMQSK